MSLRPCLVAARQLIRSKQTQKEVSEGARTEGSKWGAKKKIPNRESLLIFDGPIRDYPIKFSLYFRFDYPIQKR